jgi:hypothetical protein
LPATHQTTIYRELKKLNSPKTNEPTKEWATYKCKFTAVLFPIANLWNQLRCPKLMNE